MLLPEAPSNSDTPTADQSEGLLPVNVGQTQGRLQQGVIQDVSVARPLLCFISPQLTRLQHSRSFLPLTNAQRTSCLDLVLRLLWYHLLFAWKVSLLNSFTSLPMLVEIKSLQRQLLSLGSLYTLTPNPSITQVQRPQDGLLLSPFAKPRWKKRAHHS